jgi:hypothetical protein
MQVENCNTSEVKDSSVWQLFANKWNDPLYLPTTAAMPCIHYDFSLPFALSHDRVSLMQPAMADKVSEKW